MKTQTASRYVAGLALLIFGSIGQAAEQQSQQYVMTVIEDHAHGQLVLDGADDSAIDAITKNRTKQNFGFNDSLALCVAYTRTRQLEEATSACETAVQKSVSRRDRWKSETRGPAAMSITSRSNFALASVNRGVLYAIAGETASATESFEAALLANPNLEAAKANLNRVSSR